MSFTTTYICHVITDGFFGFVFTSAIFALKTLFVCPNDIAPIAAISTNRKAHMSLLSDGILSLLKKSNPKKLAANSYFRVFFLVFHHKISEVSRDEITFPVPFLSVEVKALFQGICNPARHSAVLFFSHFFHTDVVFVIILHSIGKANTTKTSKTSQLTGFAFLTLHISKYSLRIDIMPHTLQTCGNEYMAT